ncbi:GLUG motif-containing protein [Oceanobacillus sp. CAU 1775]
MATLIRTPQDLHNVRNNKSGTFELANDIDMSEWGNWTPIGGSSSSQRFSGDFDGKGYSIKNITIQNHSYNSIFGYMSDAKIRNLGVENALSESSNNHTGILFSYWNGRDGVVSNCYTTGTVSGVNNVGGLGGYIYAGNVENCYSNANVNASIGGGLIGRMLASDSTSVKNSYSTGSVVIEGDSTYFGGLIGNGGTSDNVTNSYWDIETSGMDTSHGGTGKTTAEMQDQSTYAGWDFDTVWAMNDYPYLQVIGIPTPPEIPSKQESREVNSHVNEIHSQLEIELPLLPPKSINVEVNSHLSSILGSSNRHVSTLVNVEGNSSRIYSNVVVSMTGANKEIRHISSHINVISSNVVTEIIRQPVFVTRQALSFVNPIHTQLDINSSVATIPVVAYLSVIENPSMTFIDKNKSHTVYIKNPTSIEVIE